MEETIEQRVQTIASRYAVKAWEYRQRNHAKGVWVRLRRLLAGSRQAFIAGDDAIERLVSRGFSSEAVGLQLEPPKRIVVVGAGDNDQIDGSREVPVRMSAEVLTASNLVLVRFE